MFVFVFVFVYWEGDEWLGVACKIALQAPAWQWRTIPQLLLLFTINSFSFVFCLFAFVFFMCSGLLVFQAQISISFLSRLVFLEVTKNAVLAKMDKYEVYIEFLVFVLCFTDVSTSWQCYAIPCEHKAKALVFIVRSYRVDRCPTWGIRNALPPSLGWAGDRIRMPQLFHSMLLLNMQGDEDFITSTPCFNVVSVIIQVLRIHCQLSAVQLMEHP